MVGEHVGCKMIEDRLRAKLAAAQEAIRAWGLQDAAKDGIIADLEAHHRKNLTELAQAHLEQLDRRDGVIAGLKEALTACAEMLDVASSGYTPGSVSDEEWDRRKKQVVDAALSILNGGNQ